MTGTSLLQPPPEDLHRQRLDIVMVRPSDLVRVSRHDTGEPYFGRSGGNRFDDASADSVQRFGTCYLGLGLTVAFAESVLHDLEPTGGRFVLPASEIDSRFALSFKGRPLRLANLTGTSLLRLGGHGEISGTSDYTLPQAWATALAAHPDRIDGLLYMSRRVNNDVAVVLFHRSGARLPGLQLRKAVPLAHHRDFLATVADLRVMFS